ncbi:hypothetical protein ACYVMA_004306 [Vibrio parahaemolyticus]|nr:hypothetical protein [Vibrio parahaemolyticus]ELA8205834.1 hypothetical protein [Vibrio parahaemolyticus]
MAKHTRFSGVIKEVLRSGNGKKTKKYHLKKLRHKIFGLPSNSIVNIALASGSVPQFDKLITPENKKVFTNGSSNFVNLGAEFVLFSLVAYFEKNKDIIYGFEEKKSEIENCLIRGEHNKCIDLIDIVNAKYGITFWSVDVRISLKYDLKNPEDILNYINSISISENEIKLLTYLFYKHSSSSIDAFLKNYFSDIQKEYRNNNMSGYVDMLSTLIMPRIYDVDREVDEAIEVAEILNPLDKYILFKKIFFDYAIKREKSEKHDLYLRFINDIYNATNDDYWLRIEDIINKKSNSDLESNKNKFKLIDLYSQGKYQQVIEETSSIIGRDLSHLDVKAKSILHLYGDNVDIDSNVFSSKLEESIVTQICILHSTPSRYDSILKSIEEINFRYYTLDLFKSLRPSIYSSYPFINKESYIESCSEAYALGFSVTPRHKGAIFESDVRFNFSINDKSDVLSDSRKARCEAQSLIKRGDIKEDEIEEILKNLDRFDDITSSEINFLKCEMYLESGMTEKVIDLISKECIKDTYNVILYPLKEVVNRIESSPRLANSISSLICVYLYSIVRNSNYNVNVSEMLEDYLVDNFSSKPSELFSSVDLDDERYFYFFSEVCSTEIMSDLLSFTSGKELILERLKIVRNLINAKGENVLLLEEEKRILAEILSHSLTLQHDKNKIYIDVDGIIKSNLNEYRVKFENIIMIKDIDESVVESLFDDINNEEDSKNKKKNLRTYIYENLYEKVVKDFITDSNFGLARSLSSEIRHGVLPNKLRSVFEGLNLVTIVGLEGEYEPNAYWRNYLENIANEDFVNYVDDCLKLFSKDIDDLIEEANSWPTISEVRDNENAIFNFSLNQDSLDRFAGVVGSKLDEVSFLDPENITDLETRDLILVLEEYIWTEIDKSFSDICDKFNEVLKIKFASIIDELKTKLNSTGLVLTKLTEQLSSAKVHIVEEISQVESWFVRPNVLIEGDFLMTDILSSSIESISAIYNPQVLNIDRSQINIGPDNTSLSSIEALGVVRALISIYQNCLSHGNNSSQTTIRITLQDKSNIVVSNEIDDRKKDYILSNGYIDKVKNFSPDSDYEKLVSEGGTGLYKIYRYLVDSSPKFNFEIDLDNNIFYQKVML